MTMLSFFRVAFKSSVNQAVVSRLIREVQALNPSFQACHIRGTIIYNINVFLQHQLTPTSRHLHKKGLQLEEDLLKVENKHADGEKDLFG